MPDADEALISEFVSQALEHEAEGEGELDLEAICADRPDLIGDVQAALDTALRLPTFQSSGVRRKGLVGALMQNRYRIDERLGAGAMGVVYTATDLDLSRQVAIKVLHLGLMDRDQAIARFEREAEALAAIRHESVVTIYDRGTTEDGAPFLVMEHIEGVSLGAILEEARARIGTADDTDWLREEFGIKGLVEPSFLRQSVRWAASLASGLHAAHTAGVYHRDVKPSNVMIRSDGRAVLLDFGIAATDTQATLTRTDAAVGTPAYMAPEALQGGAKARPAQDVYGLSATLYHQLTMRAPYEGSPSQVLTALATREPALAARIRPGLPRDVQAILDAGLARNPAKRYASADAMEADLRAFLSYRPVSARRITAVGRLWRRARRSRALQGASVAALVGLGALGWHSWNTDLAEGRKLAFETALKPLPANLGVVKYANRVLADDAATETIRQAIDAAIDADHDPVTAHTIRATFRLDHGDIEGAIADMRVVADAAGTAYAGSLAAAYAALPDDAKGAQDLTIDASATPKSAEDHYLAGFHKMRQLRYADAIPLLAHEGLVDHRHAQELGTLLMTLALKGMSKTEKFIHAAKIQDAATRIETRLGGRSSMTAHLISHALSIQERYAESLVICREGLELAPMAQATLINGAQDAYRADRYDEAVALAERAIALLPHYSKPYLTPIRAAITLNDNELAHQRIDRTPFGADQNGQAQRRSYMLLADFSEALRLYLADGASAPGINLVTERAAATLEEQGKSANKADKAYASMCEAILNDDLPKLFALLIQRQIRTPLEHHELITLTSALPDTLEQGDRDQIEQLLVAIANALAQRERMAAELMNAE